MLAKFVQLREGKSGRHPAGHPWIYRRQLRAVDPAVKPGDLVSVLDAKGKCAGTGYCNLRSDISVRLFSFDDVLIGKDFFFNAVKDAVAKRRKILVDTDAYRVVFSEADALPGLIIDRYNDTAVFQIQTAGMERFKGLITQAITEILAPAYIYEKNDSPFRAIEGLKTLNVWHGPSRRGPVEIREGKARFLIDVEHGHKTGFYLDQRRSRAALGQFVKGKSVLDLFSYTGAFAVQAALAGARHVTAVDTKSEWLELAAKNAALNNTANIIDWRKGDVFEIIKSYRSAGDVFDVVVLDPPSFLRNRSSLNSAIKGYEELNESAMRILSPGGVLATFSCSHNLPNEAFAGLIKDAAFRAKKTISILKRCHQSEDHPIVRAIPETEYLKGYFLKVDGASGVRS